LEAIHAKIPYLFSWIPLPPGVLMPWVVTAVIFAVLYFLSRNLKITGISTGQAILETLYESLLSFIEEVVGEEAAEHFLLLLSTIFVYLLSSAAIGMMPAMKSSMPFLTSCATLALIVFFATLYTGFSRHGFGYLKHFIGDPWWLFPLMLPINIISEISHPLSLTLRLFGNLVGEETIVGVLLVMVFPLLVPVPMMLLGVLTSALQALVFTFLSGIYLVSAYNKP